MAYKIELFYGTYCGYCRDFMNDTNKNDWMSGEWGRIINTLQKPILLNNGKNIKYEYKSYDIKHIERCHGNKSNDCICGKVDLIDTVPAIFITKKNKVMLFNPNLRSYQNIINELKEPKIIDKIREVFPNNCSFKKGGTSTNYKLKYIKYKLKNLKHKYKYYSHRDILEEINYFKNMFKQVLNQQNNNIDKDMDDNKKYIKLYIREKNKYINK